MVGVVFLFLQTWRATIIPVVAIPVSLVGTFSILSALGISINNLSMFGLVLAVGIVVDDAIVVVENVERNMASGMSPREAAHKTMDEVSAALIAIALTLCAVFVPAAFISGISGLFFTQFAITISASTIISVIVSLSLSPALCAVLLKPHHAHSEPRGLSRMMQLGFSRFNAGFEWLSSSYGKMTGRFVRAGALMGVVYLGLIGLTGFQMARMSTGFIPDQDIGYQAVIVFLPPGSSLERTDAVVREVNDIILKTVPGPTHTSPVAGLDVTTSTIAPNVGTVFYGLPSLYGKHIPGMNAATMLPKVRAALAGIKDAVIIVVNPPPVQGLGAAGGFKLMVEDRGDHTPQELAEASQHAGRRGQQGSGFRGCLHALQLRRAVALRRHRPREGRESRPQPDRCVLDPPTVSRFAIRERLQLLRTHLRGARPGRRAVPQDARGHRPLQGPQRHRPDGADRLGGDLQERDRAVSSAPLQSLSRRRRPRVPPPRAFLRALP